MVIKLLEFKEKMDTILENSFEKDKVFGFAIKEAFEYCINAKQSKPAELIGKDFFFFF